MSSLNTPSPVGDGSLGAAGLMSGHRGEVVKTGYLKKMKKNKKKFFVLRCESADYPARLEYYDSEKKYKTHQQPKRSISLRACFNINRRLDLKPKYVIALNTKDDCFCIVLESEEERESWLKALWALYDGDDGDGDGETPKLVFEHVWKVEVANKGLGATKNISGQYHLCLTGKTVSLVRILSDDSKDTLEFPLQNIRSFGCAQSFFYMEVGRNAVTGTGEIWMEAEDAVIAKEINRAIDAMRSKSDDSGTKQIGRSASVSESSRPIFMNRRHNNSLTDKHDGGNSMPNANDTSSSYLPNHDSFSESVRHPGRLVSSDHGSSAGRDRSDSLPSSVRPPSENHSFSMASYGHHALHLHQRNTHAHLISAGHRPHSMYTRGISHSPPVIGSSPVSPASGACSTDSAGSSLSIDEGDGWADGSDVAVSRYATNHPLTPESPIEEENGDDYVHWNGPSGLDSGVGDDEKMNNYMPMDRSAATLSLPIQQPHTGSTRKFSPGRSGQGLNLKAGTSPSHSNYMDMSPCGSSPMDTPGNYMPMSPGNAPDNMRNPTIFNRNIHQMHTAPNSANHSRTSSLAEETPDGYTPMMPGQSDDGYVEMEPSAVDGHDDLHHGEMSPSSSCSMTSGTPSTDLRFSEYALEKVNSFLTPSEEEETAERPTRCYSVGSKPDCLNKKSRIDVINQTDCSRVRAFSVGSRNAPGSKYMSRPLGHDIRARHTSQAGAHFSSSQHRHHQHTGGGKKSSSAPILSNPLSSSPMNRQMLGGSHSSVEPMDDLMEMDFSPSVVNSSKNSRSKGAGKSSGRSKSISVNEYVSMSPSDRDRLSVPGGTSHHSSQSSVASSYSTAEGVDISGHVGSPRAFENIGLGSPPKTSVLRSVYSNTIGRSPPENIARSPPNRPTAAPRLPAVARMSCISELKPQNFPMTTPSPPIKPSLLAPNNSHASMAAKMAKMAVSSPYVEMNPSTSTSKPVIATSCASKPPMESGPYVEMRGRVSSVGGSSKQNNQPTSSNSEDYLDMSFNKPRKTSVPNAKELSTSTSTEGYVEMAWKPSTDSEAGLSQKLSSDPQKSTPNDDYMNMSGSSVSSNRNRREGRGSTRRDRNQLRSQPINIQQPTLNRKIPVTPPKAPPAFLPLGASLDSQSPVSSPFSSLGRNRNRKSSKDSCGNATSLTTPTGSNSTIFPLTLNSPGSPMNPFSEDSPAGPLVPPGASFDKLEKVPADMSSGTLKLSYPHPETPKANVLINPSTEQSLTKHDYVNFSPNTNESVSVPPQEIASDDTGDYAVMCPGGVSSTSSKSDGAQKSSAFFKIVTRLPTDNDMGLNASSQSNEFPRPSSKPLTVSSLLGMSNSSSSNTASDLPSNLTSPSPAGFKLLSNRQVSVGTSITKKKLSNCDSDASPICIHSSGENLTPTSSIAKEEREVTSSTNSLIEISVPTSTGGQQSLVGPGAPIVHASPNLSPCPSPSPNPSPCSEGSSCHVSPASPASGPSGVLREKKMSSGSDSSTASRDSQLMVRKHSAGSVSPTSSGGKSKSNMTNDKSSSTPANRRLSCPSKSSVSRQVSLSSDVSDSSQMEESRISDSVMSLSRQTSSSSASGEAPSSSLVLTEKRSLSCSPVPSCASPVPRPAERQINYASLDLRTGSESEDLSTRSPRSLKTQGSLTESQSSTSSPSPNPPGGTFTYAQIDFEKSEVLRQASAVKSLKQ